MCVNSASTVLRGAGDNGGRRVIRHRFVVTACGKASRVQVHVNRTHRPIEKTGLLDNAPGTSIQGSPPTAKRPAGWLQPRRHDIVRTFFRRLEHPKKPCLHAEGFRLPRLSKPFLLRYRVLQKSGFVADRRTVRETVHGRRPGVPFVRR